MDRVAAVAVFASASVGAPDVCVEQSALPSESARPHCRLARSWDSCNLERWVLVLHCPKQWFSFQNLDQSYCVRLQQDMYFLTSNSRLNEQVVDKIILQLNRVYPQILTNAEAEKFRNPKASLHTRLSGLLKHLQKKGERHCQEFYRALQINAEQLHNDLPSRKILSPVFFLACFSVAAGFALFWYCCDSDTKVLGRARRILGFSPIIIGRHVRKICMLYLEDLSRN
ncbi:caspase recruitment domain-containing protein 19 isoform X2 [Rhea pennata]|uniref:caspase recruitment domain-containing protein 19 isoform X2 n=1 Tax=Rhea pennata TaxID=8795 RepID=UPI002E253987